MRKKGLAETEGDRNFRPPPLAIPFTSGKNATLRSFFLPVSSLSFSSANVLVLGNANPRLQELEKHDAILRS